MIPYQSINAVQFKKAGFTSGYLQFTLAGGIEANRQIQAVKSGNAVAFHSRSNNVFAEAAKLIEERPIQAYQQPSYALQQLVQNTGLDDLERLANLKAKGIITQEEFNQKKKQILGLE